MADIVSTRINRLQAVAPRSTPVQPGLGTVVDYGALLNRPLLGALSAKNTASATTDITGLGSLATQNTVNLATQVTGQLATGNVTGLGALALLNAVNLATQVSGSLAVGNVSGLGSLATKNTASATTDITGLGALALASAVNLTTQVSGSLAVGNVSGLGSLATKNTASATTDITGLGTLATLSTVNAQTQVTNLGNLAFANQVAANQLGAGQLAAGVVYAGDLYANQVVSGTFSGVSIAIASAAGGWLLNAGHNGTVVGYRRLNGYNIYAGWFDSPGEPSVMGSGYANVGVHGYSVSGASSNSHGLRGSRSTGESGIVGCANGYDFYAEGTGTNYGPFTGAHDALLLPGSEIELGDIVVDRECLVRRGLSNTLCRVERSGTAGQAGVVGVLIKIVGRLADCYVPAVFSAPIITVDDFGNAVADLDDDYERLRNNYDLALINAVGEGQINVCGAGGNLQPGDLIVASGLAGKGMRQADDVVRANTVAKCREPVVFTHPGEVKTIACIYLCG